MYNMWGLAFSEEGSSLAWAFIGRLTYADPLRRVHACDTGGSQNFALGEREGGK